MVALPSFFSFPWSLPPLPPISLPANIQRRFLSYVLKRTLGRFVKPGGLDVDRIQAQMSEGWVEIEGLEIDEKEINNLLPPSIPITLSSGSLSKITARIPFPNLWSAPLSISLDSLTLDFTISLNESSSKGKSRGVPPTLSRLASPGLDLTSSVTNAADEFLHEELDAYQEAELDRSIRQSLVLSQNDPFTSDEGLPGSFPAAAAAAAGAGQASQPGPSAPPTMESTTILAGIIERVLARLDFKVANIKIRLHHADPHHGGLFELRVGEIKYIDETAPGESTRSTVRVIKVSGLEICTLPLAKGSTTPPASAPARSVSLSLFSRSSTGSDSTDEEDSNTEMMMSLAVADLRQSVAESDAGESVYEDALSEQEDGQDETEHGTSNNDIDPMERSTTPRGFDMEPSEKPEMLLSFGTEGVTIRMTNSRSIPPPATSSTDITSPSTPACADIEIIMGTIAILLTPDKLGSILSAVQSVLPPSTEREPVAPVKAITQPRLSIKLKSDHVIAAIVYDMQRTQSAEIDNGIKRFWSQATTTYLPLGHLKLRIDNIRAAYETSAHSPAYTSRHANRAATSDPNLTLSIADLSIFEYLASAQTDSGAMPGGIFPVLIFDSDLQKQYDLPLNPVTVSSVDDGLPGIGTSENTFPSYDTVDWRDVHHQRKGSSEKLWKVRPKGRGALKVASTGEETGFAVQIEQEYSGSSVVRLSCVHLFLDLSLMERLLPMLRHIAPATRRSRSPIASPVSSAPRVTRPRSLHAVMDDLHTPQSTETSPSGVIAVVRCPVLRCDVRCPAPPKKRGTWGDSGSLRSGIVTLDVHDVTVQVGSGPPSHGSTVTRHTAEPVANVACRKVIVLFCRASEKRSAAFFVLGPLASETVEAAQDVALPFIEIAQTDEVGKTRDIMCRVPAIQSQIRQSTIEGLQFFADDLTHWLDGAFGDGSRPKPRDELKMIGSRFFGSKGSSSASSSVVEDVDEPRNGTKLRIMISEFDTRLHVPRIDASAEPGIFSLRASDIETRIESNVADRKETNLTLSIMDAEFSDRSDLSRCRRVFSRTTKPSLAMSTPPILHLHFYTSTDITDTKETGVKVSLSSCTIHVDDNLSWTEDLAAFAKTPEGVFEDVEPSEITRISVLLGDVSVLVKAPNELGALVLVLSHAAVKTDVISGADEGVIELGLSGCHLMAIDNVEAGTALSGGQTSSFESWKLAGWAALVEMTADCQVLRDLTGATGIMLDVIQSQVKVTACADSLASMGDLVADIGTSLAREKPPAVIPAAMSMSQSIDVFASVDEEAFHRMPDVAYGADLIEDDLPTNLEYLDETSHRQPKTKRSPDEDLIASALESSVLETNRAPVNGETIRILVDDPFDQEPDYWNDLPVLSGASEEDTYTGKFRVHVQNASVSVLLHDGFDWQKTRKTIEDEIKAVRRKLEKIRQLLASGQKADEPIVHGSRSVLFNSIYIGLDEQKEDLDSAALLAAIDEELDGLGTAETASQSSWQTDFPPAGPAKRDKSHRTRLRGKRLTRSKKPQIEIDVRGINLDLDIYDEASSTASRVDVTVASMEILDHIKTSTWKKFLTEMKSDSRGNMRETGADMIRVELVSVRPHSGSKAVQSSKAETEETRLKAKILPLRLHVDQDALDFFKRFFSFSMSKTPKVAQPATSPFFQHVEIFAIELKLDYKPKRVDLAALREGKTIELMNFFHFDGAEMTLRHITLSGITGWDRLSTTLQDIWTPDVKANQLADVISGVSPIRSLVNVGSGVADLILLPIEQYRKDGRVTRGVQRGTSSFVRSTAMEMMKLGARLATGTQVVLEKAEGVLGGKVDRLEVVDGLETGLPLPLGSDIDSDDETLVGDEMRRRVSRYANQPLGAKEGVQAAYKSLSKNVNAAAQTILAVPMEVYERSGPGDQGPLKAVVRAVPIAVLKPMIGASEAVSKTLLGVRNSLDPQSKRDLGDKYK
ncbi:hypothetical protein BD324DRAFT_648300 [Kockovaella imperatae]|uniref:Autophagy-related protein 2 n=1 Tax=Kockovaella imperatae TaxID=4999 RepID=A0A1Y1UR97_9TREE|nr:hypothetical protein BD324DRAFT_648300 [Kockovaella imperatae]ORX39665.1 hypothetical protein BD324DRAFT_648300 [Kockovaella imperatae]